MENDDMEMPISCQHCGEWFDLNDGVPSERWCPGTVICEQCADQEEEFIELEDELSDVRIALENAYWDLSYYTKRVEELEQELNKLNGRKEV